MGSACFYKTVIPTKQIRWCHNEEANNLGYFMSNKADGRYMEQNNLRHFMHKKEMGKYLEDDIQGISCIAHKDMLEK